MKRSTVALTFLSIISTLSTVSAMTVYSTDFRHAEDPDWGTNEDSVTGSSGWNGAHEVKISHGATHGVTLDTSSTCAKATANRPNLIFTSDNGPENLSYGFRAKGHASSGPWRGVKRDVWEGGHRTPFVLSWPGRIPGGRVSDRLISQTNIFATMADLLNRELPDDSAEDSYSFLNELLPKSNTAPRRELAIHHYGTSDKMAIRFGDWVLINAPTGSGRGAEPEWFREERGIQPHNQPVELFNLKEDPQQTVNRAADYPEKVMEMKRLLKQLEQSGRSAPKGIGNI